MDRPQRRTRQRRLRDMSLSSLLISLAVLPNAVSAYHPLYSGSRDSLPFLPPQIPIAEPPALFGAHEFTLRHIVQRGAYEYPELHRRLDIKPHTQLRTVSEDGLEDAEPAALEVPLIASSEPVTIERLADRRLSAIEEHLAAARNTGSAVALSSSDWTMDAVPGPNITDKNTVLTFAKMTANDYIEVPGTEDWEDVNGRLNYSTSFGWQNDGLRGHIYADQTNSTIVISLKGTSPALFDGAGTTTNDKVNDNLYFGCCCGQGGSYLWRQVCDCQQSAFNANLTCIVEAMNDENRYYRASLDLYSNVTELYPNSNVWMTGHSLGGAMASLLGLTFGIPVVTFEAVPEALPAARLGLPSPPGSDPRLPQTRKFTGAYHFGHTADPVYMGTCNGVSSVCTWGGYSMESACHTGQICVYDTVADKGWRVAIGTHRIRAVIADVLEVYDDVPRCAAEEECYDCELWKFFRSNGSESTTTSTPPSTTTTITSTRTSTCKTPGWWGCLDESTTTTTTATTTTTTTTSTCKTPGWFGCNDPTSTTVTTTTEAPTTTTTSACKDPGWFGCRDPTSPTTPPTSAPETSTCETPGFFWGCWGTPTAASHVITPPPALPL